MTRGTPGICMATLNNDIIQNLYELGWCLAVLFGTQHTWYGHCSISNIFATCAFRAILCLFYCSRPHHTTNMATVPRIVGVFWPYTYMEGIWVFKPWLNPFFWCCGSLFLNGTFGHGNMTCWPKCNVCVLEARIKNKECMRDHDPWFIPYEYMMDDWVVSWCTILVLEPKEKLFILLFKVIFQ